MVIMMDGTPILISIITNHHAMALVYTCRITGGLLPTTRHIIIIVTIRVVTIHITLGIVPMAVVVVVDTTLMLQVTIKAITTIFIKTLTTSIALIATAIIMAQEVIQEAIVEVVHHPDMALAHTHLTVKV